MKIFKIIIIGLLILPTFLNAQSEAFSFKEDRPFYPNSEILKTQDITWGFLTVPENWEKPKGNKVKIAVAVLKNSNKKEDAESLVFIEGGPGEGGIGRIWTWLKHPARMNNDIVIFDTRGVGLSEPKLCPDLGKEFLEILASDQSKAEDEAQKVMAAVKCQQDISNRAIDVGAYNSLSVAKDLNALKKSLNLTKWNVYGVSYGTHVAQVYTNEFPEDVNTLILDSAIPDVSKYYTNNTSNYMSSLNKVFEICKNDPTCNTRYPDLQKTYFETIKKLEANPITVKVGEDIISEGSFTYNAEDFKIAIHQSLYNEELIEVLPLLITAFNQRNENTLGALVEAFSAALRLDYGAYFCATCKEAIPLNTLESFKEDASKYAQLNGGLSFYQSDFAVCEKWGIVNDKFSDLNSDSSNLSVMNTPVLIFSGEFDPITPAINGKHTAEKFKNAHLINVANAGHAPSLLLDGAIAISDFIENPDQKPVVKLAVNQDMHFISDVKISGGVSKLANSLNELDFLFFSPLLVSIILLVASIFGFIYLLIKQKKESRPNKFLKFMMIATSITGLICMGVFVQAINGTVSENYYILAFGLPEAYSHAFIIFTTFLILTGITLLYFLLNIRKVFSKGIISAIMFSYLLIGAYFYYWDFFSPFSIS